MRQINELMGRKSIYFLNSYSKSGTNYYKTRSIKYSMTMIALYYMMYLNNLSSL